MHMSGGDRALDGMAQWKGRHEAYRAFHFSTGISGNDGSWDIILFQHHTLLQLTKPNTLEQALYAEFNWHRK